MKKIDTLSALAAYDFLQKNNQACLLDVRSTMEYQYVGHPLMAIHVPLQEPPDWQSIADFSHQVEQALAKSGYTIKTTPLLMICRSGKRSEEAAGLLLAAGCQQVYNVIEGFEGDKDDEGHRSCINGWCYHGLPWVQS